MKALLALLTLGCGASSTTTAPPPTKPAPPVPLNIDAVAKTCNDAAAGLERGTIGLREPGGTVLASMTARCMQDRWSASAIECFANMGPDDLGRCAGKLAAPPRDAMFQVLGGTDGDRASVTIVIARLSAMKVGIARCDDFVSAVASVMRCEQLPIETRVQLGAETADFWSLPTSGLPSDAQAKMEAACGESLAALERETQGCPR